MKNVIHIICLLLVLCRPCNAQNISPLTIENNVNKSDAIVEGQIINQFSQWTEGFTDPRGHVYTSVIIRVSKVFKGEIKDTIIELISEGGAYPDGPLKGKRSRWTGGNRYNWIFPGYEGMFFLKENKSDIQSGKKIQSYFYLGGISSAISYDAPGPYYLEKDIYQPIEAATQTPRKIVGLNSYEAAFYKKGMYQPLPLSDKIEPYAPLTLEDKVNKSDAVIEGEVIDTASFIIPFERVYTSIFIRVSRIFKGNVKDTIEIITDGGQRRGSKWGVPAAGDGGIYFLRNNNSDIKSGKNIQSYFYLYPHSLIEYSDYLTFYEGMRISDFNKDLYQPIKAITHTDKVLGVNSYAESRKNGVKRDKVVPPKKEFRVD